MAAVRSSRWAPTAARRRRDLVAIADGARVELGPDVATGVAASRAVVERRHRRAERPSTGSTAGWAPGATTAVDAGEFAASSGASIANHRGGVGERAAARGGARGHRGPPHRVHSRRLRRATGAGAGLRRPTRTPGASGDPLARFGGGRRPDAPGRGRGRRHRRRAVPSMRRARRRCRARRSGRRRTRPRSCSRRTKGSPS